MNTMFRVSSQITEGWLDGLLARGRVTETDVRHLSGTVYPLGLPGEADADKLIEVERHLLDKDPAWAAFLTGSLVDLVVWGERPSGTITESRARWLTERLDRLSIGTGDRLLAALRDEAIAMPAWFRFSIRHRLGSGDGAREGRRTADVTWLDAA